MVLALVHATKMTHPKENSLLKIIPALIISAGFFFYSCENDIDTIQQVTYDPKAPDEVARNLTLLYNDSGYPQIKIYATLAETYRSPEHVIKLKDGLRVDFFSEEGIMISTLTALNGEIKENEGMFRVRDSVVLRNYEKKQNLETEELNWNQNDSTIYTDKYVLIKTDGKGVTGRGEGIRTTQTFERYTIIKPVGKIDLAED